MTTPSFSSSRLSRRLLLGSSLAGAASLRLGSLHATPVSTGTASTARRQDPEATPAGWRTWYLSAPDELRPEAPGAPSQEEIDELLALQADRTDESTEVIERWGTGLAIFPWANLVGELLDEFGIGGMPQARFMAHYHTALYDAVIAAWDAQLAYDRPSPAATTDEITPVGDIDPSRPTFPSEHAAVAGAASVVLAALLPDAAPGRFEKLAMEAGDSRLLAGAAFRSDVAAGLALGRAVGERAAERARNDGSAEKWDPSTRPTGPGTWQPAPPNFVDTPLNPLAGSWRTWVMDRGDQFRPAPPPAYGSASWKSELKMIQEIAANRSFEQERAAIWWGTSSPPLLFTTWTQELIGKEGVDLPHAAQITADMHVATADALIAVWDAKYTWWTSRPITEDPNLVTVLPTPPYPSYPSGYSALMSSAATVVGHYFPDVADEMSDRAWEAAASRGWAGIHYVLDDDIGLTIGRQAGRLVCALPGANKVEGV